MTRTLDALEKLARPAELARSRVDMSLSWLEQPSLPASLRAHHLRIVEDALKTLLPAEAWAAIQGAGDVSRYRAALQALPARPSAR